MKNGVATVGRGDIRTKRSFGDYQLHVEWAEPAKVTGSSQGRGNSGVFLADRYEMQVLDSYKNATYWDGSCGAIYKQWPPLVNACRKPGEWQTYDIIFEAPRFGAQGKLVKPGYVTVLQNGVVIQNHAADSRLDLMRSSAGIHPPMPCASRFICRTTATPSATAISGSAR